MAKVQGLSGEYGILVSVIYQAASDMKWFRPGHPYHETAKMYFNSQLYKDDLLVLGLDENLVPEILRGEKNEQQ